MSLFNIVLKFFPNFDLRMSHLLAMTTLIYLPLIYSLYFLTPSAYCIYILRNTFWRTIWIIISRFLKLSLFIWRYLLKTSAFFSLKFCHFFCLSKCSFLLSKSSRRLSTLISCRFLALLLLSTDFLKFWRVYNWSL